MSWGIDFTADIFLPRQNYGENIHCVQDEIDGLAERNQDIKERMLMMAIGGTSSVSTKDAEGEECDPVDVIHLKFTELLKEYDENQEKIGNLHYYKEYLKERNKPKEH